jgi:hypothetical protein
VDISETSLEKCEGLTLSMSDKIKSLTSEVLLLDLFFKTTTSEGKVVWKVIKVPTSKLDNRVR